MLRLLLIFSFQLLFSFEGWTHLELGAGNYGADGHTKASQKMTVLMKIQNVSEAPNYIDELEEFGDGKYDPQSQYGVLFWTLDQLVERFGDSGVFHVNDLFEEYVRFAAQKLQEYATFKGYTRVQIEALKAFSIIPRTIGRPSPIFSLPPLYFP